MQRNSPAAELVEGCGVPGSQGGGHETGAVGDQVAEPRGAGGRVARNGEAVGGGRGVADKHLVEVAVLVGLGELRDVVRIHAGRNLISRVDSSPEQADGHAAG